MYTSGINMKTLFQQLGLNNSDEAIEDFINSHSLPEHKALDEADFWNPAQAAFIREGWQQDSDWALVIDQLNTRLQD